MERAVLILFFVVYIYGVSCHSTEKLPNKYIKGVAESKMATQIIALLDHYKQNDPSGIPGAPIPDPFPVPPIKKAIGFAMLSIKNAFAHGVSKFRLKKFRFDVNELTVKCEVELDMLSVKGNYTLSDLFTSTSGPFTITLKNIVAKGNASVGVELDGKLRSQDISMDLTFADLQMDFRNMGALGTIFQSFVNGAPSLIFDAMKPIILKSVYSRARKEIDSKIVEGMGNYTLPNTISPLDMAIGEARRKVREMGLDPYIAPNHNQSAGLFTAILSNTWIVGISSFYRVGDIVVTLNNKTITIELNVCTQEIMGSTEWEVSAGKMISQVGKIDFTVQYIRMGVVVSQTLDTRNQPQLNDLQLEIGNIQLRSNGAGMLDYFVEFIVNVIPNLLRYQIMDGLEGSVKAKIQDEMNKVNVEKLIKDNIPAIEKMRRNSQFNLKDFRY